MSGGEGETMPLHFLYHVEDVERGSGKGYGGLEGEIGKERDNLFIYLFFSLRIRNLSFTQLPSHRYLDLSSIAFFFLPSKKCQGYATLNS